MASATPDGGSVASKMQECLQSLLAKLRARDRYNIFAEPVTPEIAPDYRDVISEPMDFHTMSDKLEAGAYADMGSFATDFRLICTNAMKYNAMDTVFYKEADKLLAFGEKRINEASAKWESDLEKARRLVVTASLKKEPRRTKVGEAASAAPHAAAAPTMVSAARARVAPAHQVVSAAAHAVPSSMVPMAHAAYASTQAANSIASSAQLLAHANMREAAARLRASTFSSVSAIPPELRLYWVAQAARRQPAAMPVPSPAANVQRLPLRMSRIVEHHVIATGHGFASRLAMITHAAFDMAIASEVFTRGSTLSIDRELDFKPRDDALCCTVCDGFDSQASDVLLQCANPACRVVVHSRCYGVEHVPTGDWFCDPCYVGLSTAYVPCALCPCTGGALKPTLRGMEEAVALSTLQRAAATAGTKVLMPPRAHAISNAQQLQSHALRYILTPEVPATSPTSVPVATDSTATGAASTSSPLSSTAAGTGSAIVGPKFEERHPRLLNADERCIASEWVHITCAAVSPQVMPLDDKRLAPFLVPPTAFSVDPRVACSICGVAGGVLGACAHAPAGGDVSTSAPTSASPARLCGFHAHGQCARNACLRTLGASLAVPPAHSGSSATMPAVAVPMDLNTCRFFCPAHDPRPAPDVSRLPHADRMAIARALIRHAVVATGNQFTEPPSMASTHAVLRPLLLTVGGDIFSQRRQRPAMTPLPPLQIASSMGYLPRSGLNAPLGGSRPPGALPMGVSAHAPSATPASGYGMRQPAPGALTATRTPSGARPQAALSTHTLHMRMTNLLRAGVMPAVFELCARNEELVKLSQLVQAYGNYSPDTDEEGESVADPGAPIDCNSWPAASIDALPMGERERAAAAAQTGGASMAPSSRKRPGTDSLFDCTLAMAAPASTQLWTEVRPYFLRVRPARAERVLAQFLRCRTHALRYNVWQGHVPSTALALPRAFSTTPQPKLCGSAVKLSAGEASAPDKAIPVAALTVAAVAATAASRGASWRMPEGTPPGTLVLADGRCLSTPAAWPACGVKLPPLPADAEAEEMREAGLTALLQSMQGDWEQAAALQGVLRPSTMPPVDNAMLEDVITSACLAVGTAPSAITRPCSGSLPLPSSKVRTHVIIPAHPKLLQTLGSQPPVRISDDDRNNALGSPRAHGSTDSVRSADWMRLVHSVMTQQPALTSYIEQPMREVDHRVLYALNHRFPCAADKYVATYANDKMRDAEVTVHPAAQARLAAGQVGLRVVPPTVAHSSPSSTCTVVSQNAAANDRRLEYAAPSSAHWQLPLVKPMHAGEVFDPALAVTEPGAPSAWRKRQIEAAMTAMFAPGSGSGVEGASGTLDKGLATGADVDAALLFGGWSEGEEFSELRHTFVAAFSQGMRHLVSVCGAAGLCANTSFRFATPNDVGVLHAVNRVNHACSSPADFAHSIAAKNEYVLLATRNVTLPTGETEEHIVGFVNYYFAWFTPSSKNLPVRPLPAPIMYIATLQAVKAVSHPDMCGAPYDPNAKVYHSAIASSSTRRKLPEGEEDEEADVAETQGRTPTAAALKMRKRRAAQRKQSRSLSAAATQRAAAVTAAAAAAAATSATPTPAQDAGSEAGSKDKTMTAAGEASEQADGSDEEAEEDAETAAAQAAKNDREAEVALSASAEARARGSTDSGGASTAPQAGAAHVLPGAWGSKLYYPYSAFNPGAEDMTGTLLCALACVHALACNLRSVLVDSTEYARYYYLRVIGMSPLVASPGHKYFPMHLPLHASSILQMVDRRLPTPSPLSASQLSTPALARDLVAEEVNDELRDAQQLLRFVRTENDARARELLARIKRESELLDAADARAARRSARATWHVFTGFHERKTAALEEARRRAEDDMDACCAVCGSADSVPKNQIVFCDKCNVPVHQQCYGVSIIPEGDWFCIPCAQGVQPMQVPCVLCSVRGGPLLPVAGDNNAAATAAARTGGAPVGVQHKRQQWAHVVCARMFSPQVYIAAMHDRKSEDAALTSRPDAPHAGRKDAERGQGWGVHGLYSAVNASDAAPVTPSSAASSALPVPPQSPPLLAAVHAPLPVSAAAPEGGAVAGVAVEADAQALTGGNVRAGAVTRRSGATWLESNAGRHTCAVCGACDGVCIPCYVPGCKGAVHALCAAECGLLADAPPERSAPDASTLAAVQRLAEAVQKALSDGVLPPSAAAFLNLHPHSIRFLASLTPPVHPRQLAKAFQQSWPVNADARRAGASHASQRLFVFCSAHRIIIPGRLQQGAQALSERLRLESEKLREMMGPGADAQLVEDPQIAAAILSLPRSPRASPNAALQIIDMRDTLGVAFPTDVVQPASPTFAELVYYRALRLATFTSAFRPSASIDMDFLRQRWSMLSLQDRSLLVNFLRASPGARPTPGSPTAVASSPPPPSMRTSSPSLMDGTLSGMKKEDSEAVPVDVRSSTPPAASPSRKDETPLVEQVGPSSPPATDADMAGATSPASVTASARSSDETAADASVHDTSVLATPSVPDDDIVCAVCGHADSVEGNMIVICDGCDVAVHQLCYGVVSIPPDSWLCTPCSYMLPTKVLPCALCSGSGGAMKPTERGLARMIAPSHMAAALGRPVKPVPCEWAHVVCVNWVEEVAFANNDAMSMVTHMDNIPRDRWRLRCNICSKHVGAPIQCVERGCHSAYHVTCGLHQGYFFGYKEVQPSAGSTSTAATTQLRSISLCARHSRTPPANAEPVPCTKKLVCRWYNMPPELSFASVSAGPQTWTIDALCRAGALNASGQLGTGTLRDFQLAVRAAHKAAAAEAAASSTATASAPGATTAIKVALRSASATQSASNSRAGAASGTGTPTVGGRTPGLSDVLGSHRYPPMLSLTGDASSALFTPALNTLASLYGFRYNVGAQQTAAVMANAFVLPDSLRRMAGAVDVLGTSKPLGPSRSKRRRGNYEDMLLDLFDNLETGEIAIDTLAEEEEDAARHGDDPDTVDARLRDRRRFLFGPSFAQSVVLTSLFGPAAQVVQQRARIAAATAGTVAVPNAVGSSVTTVVHPGAGTPTPVPNHPMHMLAHIVPAGAGVKTEAPRPVVDGVVSAMHAPLPALVSAVVLPQAASVAVAAGAGAGVAAQGVALQRGQAGNVAVRSMQEGAPGVVEPSAPPLGEARVVAMPDAVHSPSAPLHGALSARNTVNADVVMRSAGAAPLVDGTMGELSSLLLAEPAEGAEVQQPAPMTRSAGEASVPHLHPTEDSHAMAIPTSSGGVPGAVMDVPAATLPPLMLPAEGVDASSWIAMLASDAMHEAANSACAPALSVRSSAAAGAGRSEEGGVSGKKRRRSSSSTKAHAESAGAASVGTLPLTNYFDLVGVAAELAPSTRTPIAEVVKTYAKNGEVVMERVTGTDDARYCVCRRTWQEDSSAMVECSKCHEWYHATCLQLSKCPVHLPPGPVEEQDPDDMYCLVTPEGEHLDMQQDFLCPTCSATSYGRSISKK